MEVRERRCPLSLLLLEDREELLLLLPWPLLLLLLLLLLYLLSREDSERLELKEGDGERSVIDINRA